MDTLLKVRIFFEEVCSLFGAIIFSLVISILYFLFGALLSAPYIFFSGGNFSNIPVSALIAPVAFLLLVAFWPRKELRNNGRFWDTNTFIFFVYVSYLSIPILLNLISFLAHKMGSEKLSEIIFSLRYVSLILLPVGAIILILIISFVVSLSEKARCFLERR